MRWEEIKEVEYLLKGAEERARSLKIKWREMKHKRERLELEADQKRLEELESWIYMRERKLEIRRTRYLKDLKQYYEQVKRDNRRRRRLKWKMRRREKREQIKKKLEQEIMKLEKEIKGDKEEMKKEVTVKVKKEMKSEEELWEGIRIESMRQKLVTGEKILKEEIMELKKEDVERMILPCVEDMETTLMIMKVIS